MVMLVVFAIGFSTGAALGIFSLIILEIAVCAVAVVGGWSAGSVATFANTMELEIVLAAGFLVALVVSGLSPNFEREVAYWLRKRPSAARNRLMHGPQ